MKFNNHDVTAMHVELDTTRKRVYKLILVTEIADPTDKTK